MANELLGRTVTLLFCAGYIGEEMQKILKVVSQNAAISHHDFQVIMTACEKMEVMFN